MTENKAPFKDSADKVVAHFVTHLALAKVLGYEDLRNVSAWANGLRMFPPQHCVTIERETAGAITRRELRTDWVAYWPELERRKSPRPAAPAAKSIDAVIDAALQAGLITKNPQA